MSAEHIQSFNEASVKLIALLQDKGTEILMQNVDLIRRYTGQGDNNKQAAAATSDVDMATQ